MYLFRQDEEPAVVSESMYIVPIYHGTDPYPNIGAYPPPPVFPTGIGTI